MNANLLLSWMTHMGTGRWAAFRSRVAELSGASNDDLRLLCRDLRIGLSDLGHVDFFVSGGRGWCTRKPVLAGLENADEAVFTGGRVPKLLASLRRQASDTPGCSLKAGPAGQHAGVDQVVIEGPPEALRTVARAVGIQFIPNAATSLAMAQPTIASLAEDAPSRREPVNWEVHSWSFDELKWVHGKLRDTARMYVNRHGKRRHLAALGKLGLRAMDRHDAVFAAAWRTGRPLARYEQEHRVLRTPRACPLPEGFSRAACLASGNTASAEGDHLAYYDIPPLLAWMILDRLGQPGADRMVRL